MTPSGRLDDTAINQSIACPLCPLHCDDVRVSDTGDLIADHCSIVDEFNSSSPSSDREPTTLDSAKRLSGDNGKRWRLVTTGVDLATARQLSDWQRDGQIDLTIESDASIQAILEVISRDGIVSATIADVATHADLIWTFGRVDEAWPRLMQKICQGPRGDANENVCRFGECSADSLSQFAAATRPDSGSVSNVSAETSGPAGQIARWSSSKYTAILVGPGAFAPGEESISAAMLCRLVRLRNADSRCVLVTLDSAATLRSVCLWKTNESPSSIAPDNTDVTFDIRLGSPLNRDSCPSALQIGGIDPGPKLAHAYRSSSIAGLHRRGMTIRGDGSVSLPLAAPMTGERPTPCEIIRELISQ